MSLSLGEWRVLHGIDNALRRSDPKLAAMLAMFCRLSASDVMPRHERLGTLAVRVYAVLLQATAAVAKLIARSAALTRAWSAALARVVARALVFKSWPGERSACWSPSAPLSTTSQRRRPRGRR
jgi:Protein of unknown function (DUF3040)